MFMRVIPGAATFLTARVKTPTTNLMLNRALSIETSAATREKSLLDTTILT